MDDLMAIWQSKKHIMAQPVIQWNSHRKQNLLEASQVWQFFLR